MPASRFSSPQAAASHALAALERYQAHLRKLSASWMEMDLYRRLGDELDEVRQGCREVPELTHAWVELLIAHAELVQNLWQSARPGAPASAAGRQDLLARVGRNVTALQDKCLRLVQAPRR